MTGYGAQRVLSEALNLGHGGPGEIPEHQLIILQRGSGRSHNHYFHLIERRKKNKSLKKGELDIYSVLFKVKPLLPGRHPGVRHHLRQVPGEAGHLAH